ncbi:MAG TPA: hypothetical protein VG994_05210 [Steroidobacteraceae bacterium]|nr:hypothetical protein [Steroidobacteraceae bacterium]
MARTNRRAFLVGTTALPMAAAVAKLPIDFQAGVAADLEKYVGFGNKQAGGEGDNACGNWLAAELESMGFKIERQEIAAPFFEPARSELLCGDAKAPLWPQPIVVQTAPDGTTGPLVRIDRTGHAEASLDGAIALLDLPFGRWSTALAKPIREPIAAAFAARAKAVIVITNGPTGKIIALNADGRAPMFAGPVALLAPENAEPFLAAAMRRAPATMIVRGKGGRRPAFNFVGRIDRGKPRWWVISTPRSGWYGCAGERGPGIAVWLWLARWASRSVQSRNLAFVCNTGHEYEYLGASEALKTFTPKPADTQFWLHLGANVAARDWHETLGEWRPLPSVDSQRFLAISPAMLPLAREVFAGHLGLEAPYSSYALSAGELTEIIAAGYTSAAGVFGIHRYHHVAEDDARCVSAASVAATAAAFQKLMERLI